MSQSVCFERSHEIVIDAPAGDILDYVSNPNSWPEWIAASHRLLQDGGAPDARRVTRCRSTLPSKVTACQCRSRPQSAACSSYSMRYQTFHSLTARDLRIAASRVASGSLLARAVATIRRAAGGIG